MTEGAASIFEQVGGMSIHSHYSGRGMYGATTTGVVGSREEWQQAIAEIIRQGDLLGEDEREEVAQAIARAQVDNMGLEFIYY